MIRLALVAALSVAGLPADALSCREPDPIRAFLSAQAAPEIYRILVGTIEFDAGQFGPTYQDAPGTNPVTVTARFSGQGLGLRGLVPVPDQTINLVQGCAGPWCGAIEPNGPYLMFVKQGPQGAELAIDPCGTNVFASPDPATIDALAECLAGEDCRTSDRRGN